MTKSEILHTVEALIFASGVPIKRSELYDSLPPEVTKKDINDAIKALDQTYRDPRGIVLLHIDDKVQFATNPAYGDARSSRTNSRPRAARSKRSGAASVPTMRSRRCCASN